MMVLDNAKILKRLMEDDTKSPKGFDEDPMGFILRKYTTLNKNLTDLMSKSYRQYLTAVFIVSPKPTTFKVVLHNGQYFFMVYMGEGVYQAIIFGKRYYLSNIGVKEQAMKAISRMLSYGSPLKTKGGEGAEEGTTSDTGTSGGGGMTASTGGGGTDTGTEEPTAGEETSGEEETETEEEPLTEQRIVNNIIKRILTEGDTSGSTDAEKVLEILFNVKNGIKSENDMAVLLKNKKDPNGQFLLNYFNQFIKKGIASSIYYKACSSLPKSGNAQQLGGKSYDTTQTWKNYGGLNKVTSKTDVSTDKINFSVKNGSTKVRVLDASAPQVKALINYSVDILGYKPQLEKEITTNIAKLQKLYTSSTATLSRIWQGQKYGLGELRKITDDELQKMILAFDKNTNELNKVVDVIFTKASTNPKFKDTFIQESLSGKAMFGKNSPGSADEILTFSSDFSKIKSHKIDKVTKEISANYSIPKFGTKTSGGRIAKTIQQFYAPKKEINELFDKAEKLEIKKQALLEKRTLMEDSAFQKAFDFIKQKGENVINKIKQLVNNILNNVKTFINELAELVKNSFTKTLNTLGIDLYFEENINSEAGITYDQL